MTDKRKVWLCNAVIILTMIPTFLLFEELTKDVGESISIYYLIFLIVGIVMIYITIILTSIFLINILISVFSLMICKYHKEKIIDLYFFPFHYCTRNHKLELKNIMFFSSQYINYELDDILSINDYYKLKKKVFKRNRIIIVCVSCILLVIFGISLYYQWVYGYILCLVSIIQLLTQSKFEKATQPRGVSLRVNDTYMVQFLSSQLCVQEFKISTDVLKELQSSISTLDEYQFFKEIIVSIILNPSIVCISNNEEGDLWIDDQVHFFITKDLTQIYTDKSKLHSFIGGNEINFYEHYEILLLYLVRNKGKYREEVKDYIEKMLNHIHYQQVDANYLSQKILTKSYLNFEDSYYQALKGEYIFEHDFTKVKIDHVFRRNLEKQFLIDCKILR